MFLNDDSAKDAFSAYFSYYEAQTQRHTCDRQFDRRIAIHLVDNRCRGVQKSSRNFYLISNII